MLERLAQLENNFSLLLSRGKIEPYATLDDALAAPSRFNQPVNVKVSSYFMNFHPILGTGKAKPDLLFPF